MSIFNKLQQMAKEKGAGEYAVMADSYHALKQCVIPEIRRQSEGTGAYSAALKEYNATLPNIGDVSVRFLHTRDEGALFNLSKQLKGVLFVSSVSENEPIQHVKSRAKALEFMRTRLSSNQGDIVDIELDDIWGNYGTME